MPGEFAIIMGLILFVIASVNLVIVLYEWHCDRKLVRSGVETTGRITDAATYPEIENVSSGQYRFYAEFSVSGVTYHAGSRFSGGMKDELLGREVAILYDPEDPEKSRFKNDISVMRNEAGYIIVLLAGIGLVVYGVFF
jgi:hypothetical protein